MEKKLAPTDEEMNRWRKKFRQLSNSARYREAHELSKKLVKQYPSVILFAYYEAVMTAEQEVGFSKAQVKARQKLAAKKLRKLLYRARAMTLGQRNSMRNEYYWFSRQPHKQYRLGLERVKAGEKSSYYSQGVGAEQVAKNYALRGRKALCLRWAKKSENLDR